MEEVNVNNKKRIRDDSADSDLDSPEVKRLRDDLLSGFESEANDSVPVLNELDSIMKSFEEEITLSSSSSPAPLVVDLTSDSGDSQLDLGYLLVVSDDEPGFPPVGKTEDGKVTELIGVDSSDSSENDGFWGFEDQIPPTSYELGVVGGEIYGEFVVYDEGWFEYGDIFSDVSWR